MTSDALLRRCNKARKKTNRLNIACEVWRALVSAKDQYYHRITAANREDSGGDTEIEDQLLLNLDRDLVLRLLRLWSLRQVCFLTRANSDL